MTLQDTILQKIKEEIVNDPLKLGYAGKSDQEILDLLNGDVSIERIVIDKLPPPINRILSGIQSAPNIVELKDVQDSKSAVISTGVTGV